MTVVVHTTGFVTGRDSYRKTIRLELNEGATISDLLDAMDLDSRNKYAIFVNKMRRKSPGEPIVDGSTVEIFSLIGGG